MLNTLMWAKLPTLLHLEEELREELVRVEARISSERAVREERVDLAARVGLLADAVPYVYEGDRREIVMALAALAIYREEEHEIDLLLALVEWESRPWGGTARHPRLFEILPGGLPGGAYRRNALTGNLWTEAFKEGVDLVRAWQVEKMSSMLFTPPLASTI